MSRSAYAPHRYIGADNLAEYSFNFKIEELNQLLIIEMNGDTETQRVRGTDTTYLDEVNFDEIGGGGTVTLADNLATGRVLILMIDDEEPDQPYLFSNIRRFDLKQIEMGLDWLAGAIQSLRWFKGRTVRLNDAYDQDDVTFDPQLPITPEADAVLCFSSDATTLVNGPTTSEIEAAQGYAIAASASATEAATSASASAASASAAAASAVAAAASASEGWSVFVSHVITAGQAATALTAETFLSADYSSVIYEFEVIRGTNINANGKLLLQKQNGTWRVVTSSYDGEVHGLTFTLTGTTTQQLNAAANAGDNGTLKLSKRHVAI